MKLKIKYLTVCLVALIVSCSGWEFALVDTPLIAKIKNNLNHEFAGDNKDIITQELYKLFGKTSKDSKYILKIDSKIVDTPIVIEKDASASKVETRLSIDYQLINAGNGCVIFEKKITSIATYDQRSSGYDFNSDFSKKETIKNNTKQNLNDFVDSLRINLVDLKCPDEN